MTPQIHISYRLAKMIKDFLGESAPEPMCNGWYSPEGMLYYTSAPRPYSEFPAYQLHDLLSRKFCEAFAKRGRHGYIENEYKTMKEWAWDWTELYEVLSNKNMVGGLPAVEKSLEQMIKGER